MVSEAATARSFLFVPGDRPDRFGKAAAAGADAVVFDLEDAVTADRKHVARAHVRDWLDRGNRAVVRVNSIGTPWHADDMAMVATRSGPLIAVMVPKAESPEGLEDLSRKLLEEITIIPLIETAAGILRAAAVCAAPHVLRPAFGSIDLAAQLGIDHQVHGAFQYARSALVTAAAAAGCAAPIDGVTADFTNDSRLSDDLAHAVAFGFTGKLCIHPRQVTIANRCLTPSDADLAWAREILAASHGGSATAHEGQLIDRPVILRAEAILARASRLANKAKQ
jgi:citrate lyase subunit beta / citryl-CoA lyase